METETEIFRIAEANLIEAIRQIPEAQFLTFKVSFTAYQNTGGEFEDLAATAIAAIETLLGYYETETPDFATALCALLCEIENGGAETDSSIWEARNVFENSARVSSAAIAKVVVKQFDIFEDIE